MEEKAYEAVQKEPKALPMKWYNFVVKFSMIFSGVVAILCGVIAATTLMYPLVAQVEEVEFMAYFYSGNKAFDIICGIIFIAIGVANFIVRSRMKKFAADALKKYFVLIIAQQAYFYIYDILFALVTNTKIDIADTVVFSLATAIVWCALEIYYFKKRKHLFVN